MDTTFSNCFSLQSYLIPFLSPNCTVVLHAWYRLFQELVVWIAKARNEQQYGLLFLRLLEQGNGRDGCPDRLLDHGRCRSLPSRQSRGLVICGFLETLSFVEVINSVDVVVVIWWQIRRWVLEIGDRSFLGDRCNAREGLAPLSGSDLMGFPTPFTILAKPV